MSDTTVITTLATTLTGADLEALYNRVYAFHHQLAQEMSGATAVTTNVPMPAIPADPPAWWSGLTAPFVAYAERGAGVWQVAGLADIQVGLADAQKPQRVLQGGERLDVFQVVKPASGPTWFVVYPQHPLLVMLASETVSQQP